MMALRGGLVILALAVLPVAAGVGERWAAAKEVSWVIRETFDSLQDWKPLVFPKIARHTRYGLEKAGENSVLRADADGSASAIVHKSRFSVRSYPKIRWRWKVEKVLEKGDATTKAGDDYPIRVYVIFQYDPEKASFGERIKYGAAKAIYGEYPPHSSLNYIWANRRHAEFVLPNTYTDKARMLLLESGPAKAGTWVDEERDILADYRLAFGTEPPDTATVAVMADTDNTGERVTAWVDDLSLFRSSPRP